MQPLKEKATNKERERGFELSKTKQNKKIVHLLLFSAQSIIAYYWCNIDKCCFLQRVDKSVYKEAKKSI